MAELFKFPRTRHLFNPGGTGVSRDDLLMDLGEEAAFYSSSSKKGKGKGAAAKGGKGGHLVAMEEKVDGANLGISLNADDLQFKVQNRSHFVDSSTHRQFGQLDAWLGEHSKGLFEILGDEPGRYVLFGEWLYATHSIEYTHLPDYFLAFDLYDNKEGRFFSWRERNRRLEGTGIHTVRMIGEETLSGRDDALKWLETQSAFYDGPIEGIYFRMDEDMVPSAASRSPDDPPLVYNNRRGKLVRPDFLQGIVETWTKKQFKKNTIRWN